MISDSTGNQGFRIFTGLVVGLWAGNTRTFEQVLDALPIDLAYDVAVRDAGVKMDFVKVKPTNRVSTTLRLNSATVGAPVLVKVIRDRAPEFYGLIEEIAHTPCPPDITVLRAPFQQPSQAALPQGG